VRSELEARSNPERRSKAASYFPTELEVYGVPVPKMREVLRPLARALKRDEPAVVLAVARAIVDTGVHEGRQIAYELLGGRPDIVATLDRTTLEELGEGNDNWASVDGFAAYLAGPAWRNGKVTVGGGGPRSSRPSR
jgi:3-methyladenine DNA glycosylase AlkD